MKRSKKKWNKTHFTAALKSFRCHPLGENCNSKFFLTIACLSRSSFSFTVSKLRKKKTTREEDKHDLEKDRPKTEKINFFCAMLMSQIHRSNSYLIFNYFLVCFLPFEEEKCHKEKKFWTKRPIMWLFDKFRVSMIIRIVCVWMAIHHRHSNQIFAAFSFETILNNND